MKDKNNLITQAQTFAIDAHDSISHKRKYTEEPYYKHSERVAALVASVTNDPEVIAAAWLHDVLEDIAPKNIKFNEAAIREKFGQRVLQLTLEVTDVSKAEDGNRAARKEIDRKHLAQASDEAKTIKLADLLDNLLDISQHDPKFAKIFKAEIILDLPYLQSGNAALYERLKKLL